MKNVVKCQKHFFGYFNAIKTHGVPLVKAKRLTFPGGKYLNGKSVLIANVLLMAIYFAYEDSNCLPYQLLPDEIIIIKERRECGKSTVKGLEHPWFAQLFYNKNSDSKIFCGGILVSPWMVLTSTYCAKKGKYNLGVSEVQLCTTERPQLFEFKVASCRTCRSFWKLPRLTCKNDKALRKAGVFACQFETP